MPYGAIAAAALAIALWTGCAQRQTAARRSPPLPVFSGVVTAIGGHGNAYTSIRSSNYDSLGLRAGQTIRLAFRDTSLSLLLGAGYTAVPRGEPVAVLHAESLTLAIRDGEFATRFAIAAGDSFRVFTASAP